MPINTQKFSDFSLKSVPLSSDFLVGYDPSTGVELRSTVSSIVQALLPLVQLVPTGTIITYGASAHPPGYLACDGQQYSTTEYANLYAAIGTTYGGTPGFFNVPDLRGYFVRGWDDGRDVDIIDGTYTQSGFTVTVNTNTPHGLTGGNSVILNFTSGTATDGTFTVVSAPTTTRFTYTATASKTTSGNVVLTGRSRLFGKNQDDGIESHDHSADSAGSHTHTGTADSAGSHSHNGQRITFSVGNGNVQTAWWVQGNAQATQAAGAHTHNITNNNAGSHTHSITINNAGSHTHDITINNAGSHTHDISNSGTASETRPKNIALLYCIKT